jgi:hypothetical protein
MADIVLEVLFAVMAARWDPPVIASQPQVARGIYVSPVCDSCEARIKAQYRPEVFTDGNYEAEEAIEEEE